MKKSLLILAGLMAFAATNTALAQPRDKAFEKGRKEKKELKTEQKADSFAKGNSNAAKDGGDDRLTIIPNGTLQFNITGCGATQTRPLVIKNNSDEQINGVFRFQDNNHNTLYSDIQLGDYVYGNYSVSWNNREILNYFEVNGYAYAYNNNYNAIVRTNITTGSSFRVYCPSGSYRSLAYDGKTFWAANNSGNIYALDADLNPTGKKIEVGYSVLVVWNGTELLTFERNNYPSRVKSFDANGNLKADYGYVNCYFYYAVNYNPVTGLFWASDDNSVITVFNFENGKLTIKNGFSYNGVVPGFDANGNPYIMCWDDYKVYKTEKMAFVPKGLAMQSYFDLGAGEQVTINITATTELGSRTIEIDNYGNSFSTLQIDVDAKPEYSLSAESLQFATVAGHSAESQTLWLKNTGCAPVGIPDEPTIVGDAFGILGFVLPYESFSGLLNIGDSIGVKVGCGSANAGTFNGTLTWDVTDGEAIELPLTATAAAANSFTIPESATATIDCGAGTATIAANIANNSNMTMFVNTQQHVVFDIHIVSYGDEVFWYLRDSENNIIKSVETETYNSDNTVYTEEIDLPAGEYTIELYDDNWDGWDDGGYMNVIVDGKTVLEGIRPEEYSYTTTFKVQHNALALLAEGESISQLTMPLNSLNIGGTTEIPICVEGVEGFIGSISVTTPFGEPELTVNETIDFGYQIIDPENPNLYGTQTLTIANTGCGPLLISSLAIGDDDDFMFWDEDTEGMVHTLSNISIEPNSTFEKTIYFAPSAAEECTGTLTITTGTDAATTVQLKGTGIGLPVAEYAYYYDSEKRLGFKPDTIDCSQSSTTLKGRIANSGTGPLVVNEPIKIEYQAGIRNNYYFELYDNNGDYLDEYSYNDNDYCYYFYPGVIGSIKAYGYGSNGKIIISNGKKTLHTINLADIATGAVFEFAATETDTIAPGDTLELEMTAIPDGIGEKSFYYYLTTNDPYDKNIEMNGKVRVVNAPKLVFPEVIDFGEISVGTEAWQYVTYEDEGCGNSNFENFWVTNTENPLTNDWSEVGFVPTAAGTFTNTLKVATYYYTVGSEQVKDTFDITLKGTAVVSPTAVFTTDLIPATVDYDKKVASATTTVTNTGTSTALKLWKEGNDTIVVEPGASVEIKLETSVKGKSAAAEYDIPFTYYTNDAAHPSITFYIAFPINEIFEYDFNKDSVEFAPVHTGITSYSSITLRNRGTLNVNNGDEIWFKEESNSKFNYYEVTNSVANIDDSITYYFKFRSDEAGTFRDTLYIKHGTRKTDSIPFVATAKNTSVISVSTPFANRYAVANDTIAINVTFDGTVVVVEDDELELMPQMKMNTGGFAVLDSTALLDSRDDLYTLTFLYAVQKNDNVALFDYAEDSVYMNKHVMAVDDSELCDSIALPAVSTMPKEFPVTIDNKAPQLASADLSQDGMSLDVTIKFSEPVIGFDEKCVKLTGATLNSLKTNDNQTFTASITLQNCVDIEIGIKADLKDAAGNTKKVSESKSIPAIHNYTTSVVAPTCTEAGYTLATCSLCKHEEKSDEVAATGHKPGEPTIEVKVPATETAEGKCDTVIVCTVCGAELSRKEGTIPATGNGGNNGGNGSAIADGEAATSIYAIDLTVVVEVAEADGAEISVVDMNGRVVAKAQANSTRTEIALPTAGVYVVSVGQTTEKVVLQ